MKLKPNKISIVAMALVIPLGIISLLFFLKNLGVHTFAFDELVTLYFAHDHSFFKSLRIFNKSNEPFSPFLYLYLNQVGVLFGTSEWTYRISSALSGFAGCVVLYFLGKNLFNRKIGVGAALLAGFSHQIIILSRMARPYGFLFLFINLFALFVWKVSTESGFLKSFKNKAFVFLVSSLLIYAHYFGILLFLCGLIYLLAVFPGSVVSKSKALLPFLIAPLTYLPFLPRTLKHFVFSYTSQWIPELKLETVYSFFQYYFFDSRIEQSYIYYPFQCLFMLLILYALYRSKKSQSFRFIALWFLVPVVATIIKSLLSQPVFIDRYLIIVAPAMFIAVSASLYYLLPKKTYFAVLLLLVSLQIHYHLKNHRFHPYAIGLNQLFDHMTATLEKHSDMQILPCLFLIENLDYFATQYPVLNGRIPKETTCDLKSRAQVIGNKLYFFSHHKAPDDGLLESLDQSYKRIEEVSSPTFHAIVFEKRGIQ